jgi:hypothetical protein
VGALLLVLLAGPLGPSDEVRESSLGLLPLTSLETTVRVDKQEVGRQDAHCSLDTVLDLLLARDTRRVNIVDTWTDRVGVAELLEGVKTLRSDLEASMEMTSASRRWIEGKMSLKSE